MTGSLKGGGRMSLLEEGPAAIQALLETAEERIDVGKILPHRGDWLLIGEVLAHDLGHLVADYQVPLNPSWASGHFPGRPLMPGVLLAEMGNQALALHSLLHAPAEQRDRYLPVLTKLNWDFIGPVEPGDLLTIQVEVDPSSSRAEKRGQVQIFKDLTVVARGQSIGRMWPRRRVLNGQ